MIIEDNKFKVQFPDQDGEKISFEMDRLILELRLLKDKINGPLLLQKEQETILRCNFVNDLLEGEQEFFGNKIEFREGKMIHIPSKST